MFVGRACKHLDRRRNVSNKLRSRVLQLLIWGAHPPHRRVGVAISEPCRPSCPGSRPLLAVRSTGRNSEFQMAYADIAVKTSPENIEALWLKEKVDPCISLYLSNEVNGSDVNRALYTHSLMRLSAWALSAHCVQIASSRLEVDEDGIIWASWMSSLIWGERQLPWMSPISACSRLGSHTRRWPWPDHSYNPAHYECPFYEDDRLVKWGQW